MVVRKKLVLLFSSIIMLFLSISVIVLCVWRKNSKRQRAAEWYEYYEPERNARVYVSNNAETLHVVLCLNVAEIDTDCSLRFDHACTEDQFGTIRELLERRGLEYRAVVAAPDTEGYPDLSQYIPLVLSSDERHAIWRELGLEEGL